MSATKRSAISQRPIAYDSSDDEGAASKRLKARGLRTLKPSLQKLKQDLSDTRTLTPGGYHSALDDADLGGLWESLTP